MKPYKNYILVLFVLSILSCEIIDDVLTEKNEFSIVPSSSFGRDNYILGTVYVESRKVTLSIWDHGQIDGDIVSIYINDNLIIDNWELSGSNNKFTVDVELDYRGYNYILLYAHNEGDIPPNTVSISIDDGVTMDDFILESNLESNGTIDLVVE